MKSKILFAFIVAALAQLAMSRKGHWEDSAMPKMSSEDDSEDGVQSSGDSSGDQSSNLGCHLVDRIVDFEEIGLKFVVKPKTINIGECEGHCRNLNPMSSSNTYYFLNGLIPHRQSSACCVPVEFAATQVVLSLFDSTKSRFSIKLERLDNAIVTKCGCR